MTTQEPGQNQPPGWYPDDQGVSRWWDGAAWGVAASDAEPAPPGSTAPKSRMTAGILGILLGGFGVHNFYLGFTNKAILQIVVTIFTCGIGSIWGLVEGILILTKNENYLVDANGVPLVD
jgi:hypothetical protein